MAHLMVGDDAPLLLAHDAVLLFLSDENHFHRLKEILLGYGHPAILHGEDRGLVDHIRQIRAHGSAGRQSDSLQIYRVVHLHILGMHLQDVHAALQIRAVHDDPPVKTAGTKEGRVQHLGPVRRAQHQAGRMAVEAVHLRQQLVQRLLTLVVSAQTGITALSNGVYLVDKNNAGGMLLRLLEQIPDTGSAHAHEHFHKIRAGQGEERHMGLSRHRLRKQGLSGTRRAHQKGSLGQLRADLGVFPRIVQEIHHLLEGFLGLFLTGHILERHSGVLLNVDLRSALAHIHAHHAATAAHPAHNQGEHAPEHQDRKQEIHDGRQHHCAEVRHRGVVFHAGGVQPLLQIVIRHDTSIESHFSSHSVLFLGHNVNLAGGNLYALDLFLLQHIQKFVVGYLLAGGSHISNEIPEQDPHQGHNQKHQNRLAVPGIFIVVSAAGRAAGIVVMFFHISPPCMPQPPQTLKRDSARL